MNPISISITDDNESDLVSLSKGLDEVPAFDVVLKTLSGLELLSKQKEFSIDLALIDYKMPRLDGCQTARLLKDAGFKGKILVVSHGFSKSAPGILKELGAHGFCRKEIDYLKRIIPEVFAGEVFFNERNYETWALETIYNRLEKKDADPILSLLSARDIKVLKMVSMGCSFKEIARELNLSPRTIEGIIRQMSIRVNKKPKQLLAWAFHQGIIETEDLLNPKQE